MERKNFLKTCACGISLVGITGIPVVAWPVNERISDLTGDYKAAETQCERKYAFAQKYVKRLMDIYIDQLDEQTRTDLIRTMGKTCAKGAYGDRISDSDRVTVDEFITKLGGRKEGNIIYWEYTGSPWTGLKVADGFCLCPLTEKGPDGLSGLWCECSIGYVRYMFEFFTGESFNVELLESLKRGGTRCRFKITQI